MESILAKKTLGRFHDKQTGQFQVPYDSTNLEVTKAIMTLLFSKDYVLLCVDCGESQFDYLLSPTKGYNVEPLLNCKQFVKKKYEEFGFNSVDDTIDIQCYFNNKSLQLATDRILEAGIFTSNWVNNCEPVLSMKDERTFCWCEIKGFY